MYISFRGKTRIVLLVGNKAIKFGRVRFVRLFARTVSFPFMSKRNHDRFYARYGKPFFKGAFKYLFAGLYANRNEFRHCEQFEDHRVVPTSHLFFKGWVIVQQRGKPISHERLLEGNPFHGMSVPAGFLEKDQPWQFCEIGGKILLADYGRNETREALIQTLGESLCNRPKA